MNPIFNVVPYGSTSGAITFSGAEGNIFTITLTGTTTFTFTNLKRGFFYVVIVTQDSTGGRAVSWTNSALNGEPPVNMTASSVSTITFYCTSDTTTTLYYAPGTPFDASVIPPSGDTTGATDYAAIIAASDPVLVGGQTYYTNAMLSISRLRAIGSTPATLIPAYTSAGTASDRENAVISCAGAPTATVNTTLSAVARRGARAIATTVAVPTSMAGLYIRLSGIAGAAEPGRNNIISEIVQVSLSHTTSTTVNLVQPLFMTHASGHTARSITPVQDALFENLYIAPATANTSLATGLLIKDCLRAVVKKISGSNFSYIMFDSYGSQGGQYEQITSRGTTNGTIGMETCQTSIATGIYRTDEGSLIHSLGYPIGEHFMRACCVDCSITNGLAAQAVGMSLMCGGINCTMGGFTAGVLDCRDIATNTWIGNFGMLACGGPQPTGVAEYTAEFGYGCTWFNNSCSYLVPLADYDVATANYFGIYIHDHYNITVYGMSGGRGENATPSLPYPAVCISDSSGSFTNSTFVGADFGMQFENATGFFAIDNIYLEGRAGVTNAAIAFGYTDYGPRIGKLFLSSFNTASLAAFNTGFTLTRDLTIDCLVVDQLSYYDVVAMPSAYGVSIGEIATITAGSAALAAAAGNDNVVYASPATFSPAFALVATSKASVRVGAGTPVRGDALISNASARGIIAAIPAYPDAWFFAIGTNQTSTGHILCDRKP